MPAVDTGDFSDVHLQFRRWLTIEDRAFDRAAVEVDGVVLWENATQGHLDHVDREWRFVDLPLPPGGGDATYTAAFERVVTPIIEQFAPDFALVSCGFDAHERDPLAQMRLSSQAYGAMTAQLVDALPAQCPLGLVLEGGYDLVALEQSSEAVVRALSRPGSAVPRPATSQLATEQVAALRDIHQRQAPYWRLP